MSAFFVCKSWFEHASAQMKESLEHRRQRHKTVLVHKKPSTKVESTFHKVRTVENAVPYTLVIGSGQSLSQLALHATKTVAALHKGAFLWFVVVKRN